MIDVMVDLETMGQGPGCPVLSIGAVYFDPKTAELGAEMYSVVNYESCLAAGLIPDQSTVDWWSKQSPEARKVLDAANAPQKKRGKQPNLLLQDALAEFSGFCDAAGKRSVRVWGNGSDFDNAILAHCYKLVGCGLPWEFWNNRCFRTLKSLSGLKMERSGTHHNALDDAKTQALHAGRIFAELGGKPVPRRGV